MKNWNYTVAWSISITSTRGTKRLRVCDRVLSTHGTCTSGTFRVLTVASLQRLKMEALVPVPTDCEVRSVIKVLNVQGIAPFEIHRQLCSSHFPQISRSLLQKIVTEHLLFRWVPSFLTRQEITVRSTSTFSEWQAEMSDTQRFRSHTANFHDTGIQKLVPRYNKCFNSKRWICWKIAQHLLHVFQ